MSNDRPTEPGNYQYDQSRPEQGWQPAQQYQPKKSHKLRTAVIVTGSVLAGLVFFGVLISGVSTSDAPVGVTAGSPVAPATTAPTSEPTEDTADPTPAPHPSKPTKTKPSMTASQEQAVGAARDYLEFSAFSRRGLIRQLSSEAGAGFSVKDATFAVDYLKVNWNDQAAKAAKQYLEFTHFSRAGLIRQLESSAGAGFTHKQAVYGASKAGL
jgi:hypothetical protein